MKILTVPNPALRQTSQPVTQVDKKLLLFLEDLKKTLATKKDPGGVGLAAPQVGKLWRIFATQLVDTAREYLPLEVFINPVITDHSQKLSFGPDKNDPDLEGCLSVPHLYGPVPRFDWVELEYQSIQDGQLQTQRRRLTDLNARIVQHERDHLDGILFTDYILEYDLPIYRLHQKKLDEVEDKSLLELY